MQVIDSPIEVLEEPSQFSLGVSSGISATVTKKRKLQEQYAGRALYLFAGPKRKSTIGPLLRKAGWEVVEVDILQGGKDHDLTRQVVQEKLLQKIASGYFDLILTSPPCDTFSRVKYANSWGPRPTRSMRFRRRFSLVGRTC
jgi:site-specific DNA-cytosine methylase